MPRLQDADPTPTSRSSKKPRRSTRRCGSCIPFSVEARLILVRRLLESYGPTGSYWRIAVRRATHRLLNSDPHRKPAPEVVPKSAWRKFRQIGTGTSISGPLPFLCIDGAVGCLPKRLRNAALSVFCMGENVPAGARCDFCATLVCTARGRRGWATATSDPPLVPLSLPRSRQ